MISVFRDYENKVSEINLYFDYLKNTSFHNQELFKILKANSFLMLYNLIESTVRNALEEIHNNINSENVSYIDSVDELKAIWIEFQYKKFKEKSSKMIISNLNTISLDTINVLYADYIKNKSNDISGNLDRRKIEELAEKYKFDKNKRVSGTELYTVKIRRNSLAHGEISFTEVGKAYNFNDLNKIKRVTFLYLKEMLFCMESYLIKKQYKITV